MNEAEKRRRELLEQTRYSYQESGIPAIHPRYRASYSELMVRKRQNREAWESVHLFV